MQRSRASRIVPWLLLAVVALIVYVSLYPFDFTSTAVGGGLIEAVHALSWARAGRGDQVSNILLYIPFGFCAFLWLERFCPRAGAMALTLLGGFLLSFGIEVAQGYLPARVPSFLDLALNVAGTLVGAIAGAVWHSLGGFVYLPATVRTGGVPAIAVVVTWLAWRLVPFVPRFDLAKLKAALAPLARPDVDVALMGRYLLAWLVVAQAIFGLAHRQRGLDWLLGLIATVLLARLLIDTQTFVPAELLALLLLLPGLVLLNGLRHLPRVLFLVAGLTLTLTWVELAPHLPLDTPRAFDLWPFLGWMAAGLPTDPAWLLEHIFLYAALGWLLRELGLGPTPGAVAVLAIVLMIEFADMWQADGSPGITRPALATATLLIIRLLSDQQPRRPA
jgi:VanZ family protein